MDDPIASIITQDQDVDRNHQVQVAAIDHDVSIYSDVRETFEVMRLISETAVSPFSINDSYAYKRMTAS